MYPTLKVEGGSFPKKKVEGGSVIVVFVTHVGVDESTATWKELLNRQVKKNTSRWQLPNLCAIRVK